MTKTELDLLNHQSSRIIHAIQERGYLVRQLEGMQWEITRLSDDFFAVLVWLPRPVGQWRILPIADLAYHSELYHAIESAIGGRR